MQWNLNRILPQFLDSIEIRLCSIGSIEIRLPSIEILRSIAFNYARYSSGWQIPVKNDLDTVAKEERTLVAEKNILWTGTTEASQSNAIESQSNPKIGVIFDWDSIAFDNQISTVRLRLIGSIVESVRLRSSGNQVRLLRMALGLIYLAYAKTRFYILRPHVRIFYGRAECRLSLCLNHRRFVVFITIVVHPNNEFMYARKIESDCATSLCCFYSRWGKWTVSSILYRLSPAPSSSIYLPIRFINSLSINSRETEISHFMQRY